ncbi:HNH endonuclease signature motif containing protein [Methanococcoides seepicolus]|uniref:HNH endonuclease n=1 Tax=Methanococcoides seepicolus TaxID=2828780 RepID=A0A9E5DBV0_9EURY|nr:HNH endonuclease [Methanococcoides seepicolus]MCM1987491.1 HNH endonuclease [Methanococcoides seepicolus]
MDKEEYANYIKRNKKGKKPPIACAVCGEDDANVIEMHHVDGRNTSDWVKPLCKNCHAKITAEQNKLNPKARSKKASSENLTAFNIISIGALLRELGQRLINVGMEMPVNV